MLQNSVDLVNSTPRIHSQNSVLLVIFAGTISIEAWNLTNSISGTRVAFPKHMKGV